MWVTVLYGVIHSNRDVLLNPVAYPQPEVAIVSQRGRRPHKIDVVGCRR